MSTRSDEGLLPLIDDRSDHDDIAVTLEPSMNREHHHHLDDSLSSVSDTPSVDHFNISFEYKKTFREHKGATAGPKLEREVKKVYEHVVQCTYRCHVYMFGFILAVLWGSTNGCVAFLQTWFISPCMRVLFVLLGGLLPICTEPVRICVSAFCEACKSTSSAITEKLGALHMSRS